MPAAHLFNCFVLGPKNASVPVKTQAVELRRALSPHIDKDRGDVLGRGKTTRRSGWTVDPAVSAASLVGVVELSGGHEPKHLQDCVQAHSAQYPDSTLVFTSVKDSGDFSVEVYTAGHRPHRWAGAVTALWNPETRSLEDVTEAFSSGEDPLLDTETDWGWRLLETLAVSSPRILAVQDLVAAGFTPPSSSPEPVNDPQPSTARRRRP